MAAFDIRPYDIVLVIRECLLTCTRGGRKRDEEGRTVGSARPVRPVVRRAESRDDPQASRRHKLMDSHTSEKAYHRAHLAGML